MTIGTRSLLYGVHAVWLHPWMVALGWIKMYGFPWDPRLWAAFFVHDLGYAGKSNMDGPEGEDHVLLGARIMRRLFGHPWGMWCFAHSRYRARKLGCRLSTLCVADKASVLFMPNWLYVLLGSASGEVQEYLRIGKAQEVMRQDFMSTDPWAFIRRYKAWVRTWVGLNWYKAWTPDQYK